MYYQSYEDYIRSILGYPVAQNSYVDTYNGNNIIAQNTGYSSQIPMYSKEIMDLYPDIYKIINPMVCKICEANTKPITKELVDAMTDEIYMNIESDPSVVDTINVRVNLPKEEKIESNKGNNSVQSKNRVTNVNSSKSTTSAIVNSSRPKETRTEKNVRQERAINSLHKQEKVTEEVKKTSENSGVRDDREYRQARRNTTLQDLIRILILNQLLGGNGRPPRPRPPRPPYPGIPGQNPRPPFPGGGRS